MKILGAFFVTTFILYAQALDCGIRRLSNDQIKNVIKDCVKDNQTLNKIWELAFTVSSEDDTSISSKEKQEMPVIKSLVNNVNNRNMKRLRTKRSRNSNIYNSSNTQRKLSKEGTTTTLVPITTAMESEENIVNDSKDVCILQCIFEKLDMADSNGLPDHKKFATALVKTASRKEIRDFLQESTDECFQRTEEEDSQNPCEYSSKLVMCLAEKGIANCEDWPTENLQF